MALRRYAKTSVHTSAPGVTRTPQAYVHYSVFTVYECTGCSKKKQKFTCRSIFYSDYFLVCLLLSFFHAVCTVLLTNKHTYNLVAIQHK